MKFASLFTKAKPYGLRDIESEERLTELILSKDYLNNNAFSGEGKSGIASYRVHIPVTDTGERLRHLLEDFVAKRRSDYLEVGFSIPKNEKLLVFSGLDYDKRALHIQVHEHIRELIPIIYDYINTKKVGKIALEGQGLKTRN